MTRSTINFGVASAMALTVAVAAPARAQDAPPSPTVDILRVLPERAMETVIRDVVERNPDVAAARARAAAAAQRAPQVSSLPDPVAAFTFYLQTPETRVGPQDAMLNVSQRIPWFGTLDIRERAAVAEAAAALSDVETVSLGTLTEARVLVHELAFLDVRAEILREEAETLDHFEELARARYASGVGLDQAVIKIQAEIARVQTELIGLDVTRTELVARLNALRDRVGAEVPAFDLAAPVVPELDPDALRAAALALRPEVAAARARLAAAGRRVELAEKAFGPDLSAGITYTAVGSRSDADVPDEGKDIVGITGSVSLPIWRGRLHAGVEEAVQARLAAEEELRSVASSVTEEVADLARRVPLIAEQRQLFDDLLLIQAEESLSSALEAYSAGTSGALDLLDAERVLFQVRVAAARSRADLAIAMARLERAVARPIRQGGLQ